MTRLIAIVAVFLAIAPPLAAAQTLADVAKAEEARRKSVKKPAKVLGNNDLKDSGKPSTPATSTAAPTDPAAPATPPPGAAPVNIPLSPDPGAVTKPSAQDEAFWKDRIVTARATLDRTRLFGDALQSRINALTTDFVNRDDPAQRSVIEQDRLKAMAELEKVRREMNDQTKAIADIQEEARKAGVPAAWVR